MTHFKSWLWMHFDQTIGFVGGFSYGLLNIHLSLPVQEFMFKILVAFFVGFMTAVGGWLFKLLIKIFTPKQK